VLSWFCFKFLSDGKIRNKSYMYMNYIVSAGFFAKLSDGFEERKTFNVPHCSSNFNNDNIKLFFFCYFFNSVFYFIGNMRNNLNCSTQKIASSFLLNNSPIDHTGSYVIYFSKIDVDKSFIMTQIKICLCPIFGNKNLSMLIWAHCAWINVDVWI